MRTEATRAVERANGAPPRPVGPGVGGDAEAGLARAVGARQAPRLERQLRQAAKAFGAERYREARGLLAPLAKQAPGAAPVRELLGLSLYRLGQWRPAARELEAFRALTGSTEQHPVLADCYRGLGRWSDAEGLWAELREASPSAPLVAEGRIVAAGALADQGRLADAVRLLERAPRARGKAQEHHLRVAYALADLQERVGDVARARELFGWVRGQDPGFADVGDRVSNL